MEAAMLRHSFLANNQMTNKALRQYQESPEWAIIVDNRQINLEDGFKRILLVR